MYKFSFWQKITSLSMSFNLVTQRTTIDLRPELDQDKVSVDNALHRFQGHWCVQRLTLKAPNTTAADDTHK